MQRCSIMHCPFSVSQYYRRHRLWCGLICDTSWLQALLDFKASNNFSTFQLKGCPKNAKKCSNLLKKYISNHFVSFACVTENILMLHKYLSSNGIVVNVP